MNSLFTFLKSLTVVPAFAVALVRYKTIGPEYLPFVLYLSLSVIAEVVSYILIYFFKTGNAIPTNIFVLAELLLLLWQFNSWGFFRRSKTLLILFAAGGTLVWIIENIIFGGIFIFGPYFKWLYSFVIVIMSINMINYTVIHEYKNILRNGRFLICLALIIFFSYKMVYEWAYQVSYIKKYESLSSDITSLFGYLNAITNLLYLAAALLIPAREKNGYEIRIT